MRTRKRLVARGIAGIVCAFLAAGFNCLPPAPPDEPDNEPGAPIPPIINLPPTASAVADPTTAHPGDTVSLDASGSSDPEGDALSFLWEPTSDTPALTIADPAAATTSFTAPLVTADTVVTLRVSVSDGTFTSMALVDVTILGPLPNRTPLAAAFVDPVEAHGGTTVTLDASGSSDPDGDALVFAWEQTGGAPRVQLTDPGAAVASFMAPRVSPNQRVLTFTVTVGDGELNSTASVDVTILPYHGIIGGGGPLGDVTPPDVAIDQTIGQIDPAPGPVIGFTVVFTEPVVGFTTGDVTLGGTAGATTHVVAEIAPNDGTTYNVAVTGMVANGTVIATVAPGVATDAAGNPNTASTSVDNIVTYDGIAPLLNAAVSRKTHGLAGDFDVNLPLAPAANAAGTEGRLGGPTRVLLTFSEPIRPADGILTPDGEVTTEVGGVPTGGLIVALALNPAGDVLTVDLAAVPDPSCLRIVLAGIEDMATNPLAGDNDVHIRVLVGDANTDGVVDNTDVIQVRLQNGLPIAAANYRCDVNVDGVIDNADAIEVRNRRGNTVVCP